MLNVSESLAQLLLIIDEHPHRRVVLIGPQGAGKSTLGQMAAQRCGIPWFDSDILLLQRFQNAYGVEAASSIQGVYRTLGWWRFRRWENQVVQQLQQIDGPAIISLGGGAHVYALACRPLFKQSIVVGVDRLAVSSWGSWLRVYVMRYYAVCLLGLNS